MEKDKFESDPGDCSERHESSQLRRIGKKEGNGTSSRKRKKREKLNERGGKTESGHLDQSTERPGPIRRENFL